MITQLYSNGDGRVDDQYPFHSEASCGLNINQGDTVICMARKISEERPVEIYKIYCRKEDEWGEDGISPETKSPVALKTQREWFGGRVLHKINGDLLIDILRIDKKLRIPMNEIGCTFIPSIGDDLNIQLEYGVDDGGEVTEILGFYALRPIRTKSIIGKIDLFKKKMSFGTVDKEYLFYMDVLQHSDNRDNIPNVGDSIDAEVISGEYNIQNERSLFWRCIRLVRNRQNSDQPTTYRNLLELNAGYGSDDEQNVDVASGIEITSNQQLQVSLESTNDREIIELIVYNETNRLRNISPVKFEHEIMSSQISCPDLFRNHEIQPNGRYKYSLEVIGKICGNTRIHINFTVDNQYTLRRCITVHVKHYGGEDSGAVRILRSTAYTKSIFDQKANIQRGVRPVDMPRFIDNRLLNFPVPKKLFEATLQSTSYAALDASLPDVAETLSHHRAKNYAEYFHYLLYFEEVFLRHEFRRYDQERGHFFRDGEYLAYEMKGNIFECRPSIVVGDHIKVESLISRETNENPLQWIGYIHKITRNRLLLKFDEEFQSFYNGEDYKLIFEFSRSKLNKLHNAVHRVGERLLRESAELMFPTKIPSQKQLQVSISLVNGELHGTQPIKKWELCNSRLNIIQKEAVCNILRGEARSVPYVIFGPPGTGKTSTLIELILQLVRKRDTNLIVCTPSNSSANLITKLLIDSKRMDCGEFVRIVSQNSLERESIPEEIHRYCLTTDIAAPRSRATQQQRSNTGIKLHCDSAMLSTYRILISTCSTMGSLLYMKFRKTHFTHVIIDEAGQCTGM